MLHYRGETQHMNLLNVNSNFYFKQFVYICYPPFLKTRGIAHKDDLD